MSGSIWACKARAIFEDPSSAELFAEYERESANAMLGPCAPSLGRYEQLEACGAGQCFAAYSDGMLAGFAFVVVGPVPHHSRKLAMVESLFVASARSGYLGGRLMNAIESCYREAGCEDLIYHAPARSRLAVMLFLHEDEYANTGHVFCRRLV